jgi:hypothetical protein
VDRPRRNENTNTFPRLPDGCLARRNEVLSMSDRGLSGEGEANPRGDGERGGAP